VRSGTFIAVAGLVVVFLAGGAGVYAYDEGTEDQVAQGVRVDGIHLGGLSRDQAREKLRAELLEPLSEPVRRALPRRALPADRQGGEDRREHRRDGRRGRGPRPRRQRRHPRLPQPHRRRDPGDIDPEISYSSEAVGRLISRVKRRTERDARDAKVDFSATG
jgi:hypothetical protein